jgi:hypothetical protein
VIQVVICAGGSYASREASIASALQSDHLTSKVAVLLEGLPSEQSFLENSTRLTVERIAPGCFCCIGQLAMRVTLNRLIRKQPEILYLAINDASHLHSLQTALTAEPYSNLLKLRNVLTL